MKKFLLGICCVCLCAAMFAAPPVYLLADGKRVTAAEATALPNKKITLTAPKEGEVVPLLSAKQKKYLAMPRQERIAFFADKESRKTMASWGDAPKTVTLAWNPTAKTQNYIVTVSETPDMKDAIRVTTAKTSVQLGNLKIATAYYWCVSDGKNASKVASFRTEDIAPRLLKVAGVRNVRDLGGRKTLDGKRVKQGMIYRNGGLNDNASGEKAGKVRFTELSRTYFVEDLGVKIDLDLRSDKECAGMTGSPAGEKVQWCHISSSSYDYMQGGYGRRAFQQGFKLFLDENNYPVDFHCIAGQDRTGALAFILNGLLGVPEEELYLDWEETGFQNPSTRFCHERLFNKLVTGFDRFEGATLNERIVQYVLDNGFTQEDIEKFRSIMLEK